MTEMEFAKGMAFLAACLDRDISETTVEAWYMLLGDMEARQFERSVVEVVRGHRFSGLPPVGLIRQAAGMSGGVADADSTAILAWGKVVDAMRQLGGYRSIQWDDPAIPPAIGAAAGTWPRLCETEIDELHNFARARFVAAYKAHRTARPSGDATSPGLIAADSGRIGFDRPEPVRIGAEAQSVYGFLAGREPKALPSPAKSLCDAMPKLIDDEQRPPKPIDVRAGQDETPAEFERRRAELIRRAAMKFAPENAVLTKEQSCQ